MSTGQRAVLDIMGVNAVCTVWPNEGRSGYGQVSFGIPYTIEAEFKSSNGTTRNASGTEIVFSSSFFTEENGVTTLIRDGDRILNGDNTATLDPIAAGAYEVLSVDKFSPVLEGDLNDLAVRA